MQFVGAETKNDSLYALSRLKKAFLKAGYESVGFRILEPVAAAYHYESTLDHDELILIGDFGGGTSDFSLLRVGPGVRKRGRTPQDLLGNSGVGLAGDAFDAKIVRNLVSPRLGAGVAARSRGRRCCRRFRTGFTSNSSAGIIFPFCGPAAVMTMLRSARVQALDCSQAGSGAVGRPVENRRRDFDLLRWGFLLEILRDEIRAFAAADQRGKAGSGQQAGAADAAESLRRALDQGDKAVALKNVMGGDFDCGEQLNAGRGRRSRISVTTSCSGRGPRR